MIETDNSTEDTASATATPSVEGLYRDRDVIPVCWPHPDSRPKLRTFQEWSRKGFFPKRRVGKYLFYSPSEVLRGLENRFSVKAKG